MDITPLLYALQKRARYKPFIMAATLFVPLSTAALLLTPSLPLYLNAGIPALCATALGGVFASGRIAPYRRASAVLRTAAFLAAAPAALLTQPGTRAVPLVLLTLGGIALSGRMWCSWVCPAGGLRAVLRRPRHARVGRTSPCPLRLLADLAAKAHPFRMTRDAARCTGCGECRSACGPYRGIPSAGEVPSRCTLCLACVERCRTEARQTAPGVPLILLTGFAAGGAFMLAALSLLVR